jgi:hypothetical protein
MNVLLNAFDHWSYLRDSETISVWAHGYNPTTPRKFRLGLKLLP